MNKELFTLTLLIFGGSCMFEDDFQLSQISYNEGQRFFMFPDGNGQLPLVDANEYEEERKFNADTDVVLNLYTRKNPTNENIIVNGNIHSLESSTLDKSKPVKIIVHGWKSDSDGKINKILTEAFLIASDVNVICVDWSKGSDGVYTAAVLNTPKVGVFLSKLIDWLSDNGVPLENFHVMGDSLGAHAAGIATRKISKGLVPYLTAFDPASPLWGSNSDRVRKTDAVYVEVIHTNAGDIGIEEPLGDTDFYPNRGKSQPGCSINAACSHSRSYEYFADSLDHTGFMAKQCKDYEEIKDRECTILGQLHMGGLNPKKASGVYYLKTNSEQPYYQG